MALKNVERWFRELPPDMVHGFAESAADVTMGPALVCIANDWLLERGYGPHKRRPRRAPTTSELAMINALKACRFPPASFSKRFARELSEAEVTDGQVAQVRRLVTTYRKQISPEALHEADRHLLSKSKKSQR